MDWYYVVVLHDTHGRIRGYLYWPDSGPEPDWTTDITRAELRRSESAALWDRSQAPTLPPGWYTAVEQRRV